MSTEVQGSKIEFVEYHPPDLADGDYTLTVTQTIEAKQQISAKQNFDETLPEVSLRFSVLGPRFTLDPQLITSVFPPAGSLGDHSNVLPHIVFNRSTLPWERKAISIKEDIFDKLEDGVKKLLEEEKKKLSWLILLLFEEGEFASPFVSLATLQGHQGSVTSAQFSPDGMSVVTTSEDKTARLWETKSGRLLATLQGHQGSVTSAQFSPDGKRIVTASGDRTARLWETESGKLISIFQGHSDQVNSAVFSPDGLRVLTASRDQTARLWEADSGKQLTTFQGHGGWVISAIFSPDGLRVLTASDDKTARLWEADSGKLLAIFQGHSDQVNSAVFSPDGLRVLTASRDQTARLWEADGGKLLTTFQGHGGWVISAIFSPDGLRVLTASDDKTARLWEAEHGGPLTTFQGHQGSVTSAQFSPDGKRIVTASGDKTARLWARDSGWFLTTLQGHQGSVTSAQFSPDGKGIVTASKDKTARLWETYPVEVSDLKNLKTGEIKWPGISLESGQHESDQLSLIDVPWSCLKQIIPTGKDLKLLTHVRKTKESTGKPGEDELAVILGSRLPKPGSISWVHLVSVEGRYKYEGDKNKFESHNIVFDHESAQDGDSIRLVSLKSWRFTCADEKSSFTGLLTNLEHKSSLRLPDPEDKDADPSILDALAVAKDYLAKGCVPLPHAMRQGNKAVSWYRGPLLSGNNTTKEFPLPIRSADELVYYDKRVVMFDVSYAAAWELGRLLALQSKSFATNLYRWKRSHARKTKDAKLKDELKDAEIQLTHLPFHGPTADLELPEAVSGWFENLALLEGVPFHYLVPDDRMLPDESIRFFQIDPIWMECLVDGAFSIGRVLESDHERDQWHKKNQLGDFLPEKASGFLLRSDVVAGWPGLQVDGYDESIDKAEFAPKKSLFEIDPKDCESDLNKRKISAKLEQQFQATKINETKIELSKDKCAVANQQWLLSEQKFTLIKRENNQIDVCDAADTKFLFSIDGALETDLNAAIDSGKLSTELRQAFAKQQQKLSKQQPKLSENSPLSVVSWFITDNDHQKHYLIQKEGDKLSVYRDYKLPLLRMSRLSANILICLFEGIVQMVDLHLKPDTLHCGVDHGFHKKLRDLTGRETNLSIDSIHWREKEKRVIDIGQLAEDIQNLTKAKNFSAADFALEMIEGAPKVRFCFPSAPTGH